MRSKRLSFWLVSLLTVLALGLAVLQIRWITELNRLETERLQRALVRETNLVARTFERELGRLLVAFPGPDDTRLRQQLVDWRLAAGDLDLLLGVYRYDFSNGELFAVETGVDDRPSSDTPAQWPAELEPLRPRLAQLGQAVRNRRVRDPRAVFGALGGSPLIAEGSFLARPLLAEPPRLGARRRNARRSVDATRLSLLLLHLDTELLTQSLAALVGSRLETDLDLRLETALFGADGRLVGTIDRGTWQAGGESSPAAAQAVRRQFRDAIKVPIASSRAFLDEGRLRPFSGGGPLPPAGRDLRQGNQRRGAWVLAVQPEPGSLRSTVARQRAGGLLLSGAMVVLLALSGILLYRAARRAEQFAQRQTDFVASISHELHTPLAAISSAGANLADGVIDDPARVREYGELLQKEGKRLARTVGQALALAGVESDVDGQRSSASELSNALHQAVEETRLLADQVGGEVIFDQRVFEELPRIAMPPDDLVRVLDNLLTNSFKYGAHRVELSARPHGGGRWVQLQVGDDGPGIAKEDESRIFQPFRRGRQRTESALAGSGLGLYLVSRILERAGGDIRLTDSRQSRGERERRGAHFSLRLPTAERPTPKEDLRTESA